MLGLQAVGCYAALASLGALVGLALAGEAVIRQHYLEQGLRRTALWAVSGGAGLGVLIGAAAGITCLGLLAVWSGPMTRGPERRGRPEPDSGFGLLTCPRWAVQVALFLGLVSAAVVLVIPRSAALRFGSTRADYLGVVVSALALSWVLAIWFAAFITARYSDEQLPRQWFRFRWLSVLSLAWVAALLHLWNRAQPWQPFGVRAFVGLVLCAAAYFLLSGVARVVHDRIGRPLGAALAGRPGRVLSAVVLAFSIALWGGGWATKGGARRQAKAHARNVIVIGLDTVRFDRTALLSEDERDRDLTPNLRELLAARGTVFSKAISQASWTLPAFASIFTGLYPAQHGAEQRWHVLAASQLTLAEILREAGYRTVGVVSGRYMTKAAGMAQGFELFDESPVGDRRTISSAEVTNRTVALLRAHRDEPLFVFAHYFDPHWIYREHHDERGFPNGYDGPLRDASQRMTQDELLKHMSAIDPQPGNPVLDPEDMQYLRNLYDGEIAFADTQIGGLLRYIREAGLEEDSLIVVVADHGEEFLERGNLGHGKTVYQELVHVPLAVVEPTSRTASVIEQPVETRALFTTILGFLDVQAPPDGRFSAALPSMATEEETLVRTATHTQPMDIGGLRLMRPVDVWWTCIQDGRWKLIKEHWHDRVLLYDLKNDPGETRSCAAQYPEEHQRLARKLDELDAQVLAGASVSARPEVDADLRRHLKALGYL